MDCMSTLNNASFMLACFPEELVSDFNEIIHYLVTIMPVPLQVPGKKTNS